MTLGRAALLLDLDGVLVHDVDAHSPQREVLVLHDDVGEQLRRLPHHVFVLTHRSRAEAKAILRALGLTEQIVRRCYAAEDIALHGILCRPLHLLRSGLRKSLVLSSIAKTSQITPARMCFVDDRAENVSDTLDAGLGLGMVAPIAAAADGAVDTFEFGEMIDTFLRWADETPVVQGERGRLYRLAPHRRAIEDQHHTAVAFPDLSRQPFANARRWARGIRTRRLKRTVPG